MRVGIWNQGAYAGYPDKPELQVKWFLDNAEAVKKAAPRGGQADRRPEPVRRLDRRRRAPRRAVPRPLPDQARRGSGPAQEPRRAAAAAPAAGAARRGRRGGAPSLPAGGGGSSLGAAALQLAADRQRGVREIGGANRGPQVEQYLAAAKVAPGNPWCASFITWSLEQAGHKMPGGGWAGVATWVRNAEQGNNGLKIVSAAGRAARRHRRLRLGRPERLRLRRPHRVPRQHGQRRQVHRAGGQQRRRGQQSSRARSAAARTSSSSASRATRRAGAGVAAPAGQAVARRRPRRGRRVDADRPDAVRRRGHGRPAGPRGARAAEQQEHRARRRTGSPTSRPAGSTRASSAVLTKLSQRAQDHGHVHVLRPRQVHRGRLGLQPPLRPRHGHRRRSTARSSAPAARSRARWPASSRR